LESSPCASALSTASPVQNQKAFKSRKARRLRAVTQDEAAKEFACHVIDQAFRDYEGLKKRGAITTDGRVNTKLKMERTVLSGESGNGRGTRGWARELVDFFHAKGGGLELWISVANLDLSPQTIRDRLTKGSVRRRTETDDLDSVWGSQIGAVL
jgi:hypothetical protein